MMTSLSRFWPLLENLRPLAAVSAEWQLWLGPEFAQLRPLLRPQDTLATAYPKLVAGRSPLPYRVVTHGPEDHEGICPDTEEILRLTTAQLTVYELSETSLLRSLARALGVQGLWEALAGFRDTYRLGIRRTNGSRDRPVFFSYAGDPSAQRHLADHLAATDGPAILATPTSATHTAALAESVRRRGSLLLTLDNAVAVGADGQFVATIDLDAAVAHEDLATRPTVTVDSGLNVFHRRGDFWQLAFAGTTAQARHRAGLPYIAQTLAHPGRTFSCLELQAVVKGDDRMLAASRSGELIDREALSVYHQQILDVEDEIAEAEEFHDFVRHEQLSAKRDHLLQEVSRGSRLGGQLRFDGPRERARKSVTNAVREAFKVIAKVHPPLAAHLKAFLHRGGSMCYQPETPLRWLT